MHVPRCLLIGEKHVYLSNLLSFRQRISHVPHFLKKFLHKYIIDFAHKFSSVRNPFEPSRDQNIQYTSHSSHYATHRAQITIRSGNLGCLLWDLSKLIGFSSTCLVWSQLYSHRLGCLGLFQEDTLILMKPAYLLRAFRDGGFRRCSHIDRCINPAHWWLLKVASVVLRVFWQSLWLHRCRTSLHAPSYFRPFWF